MQLNWLHLIRRDAINPNRFDHCIYRACRLGFCGLARICHCKVLSFLSFKTNQPSWSGSIRNSLLPLLQESCSRRRCDHVVQCLQDIASLW